MGPAHKKTRQLHNPPPLSALIIPFFAPPCRPPRRRRTPKRPKRPARRHAAHDVKTLIIIGRPRPPNTCGPQAHRPANSLLRVVPSHLRRHHTTPPNPTSTPSSPGKIPCAPAPQSIPPSHLACRAAARPFATGFAVEYQRLPCHTARGKPIRLRLGCVPGKIPSREAACLPHVFAPPAIVVRHATR